jgi:uncharacterized membrane protein
MEPRRRDVSRIEGFSDAVFAFAITLLVVSLEVPKTFHELLATVRGFPAFAVSFGLIFQIWRRHYRFFRSYDLEDRHVVTLTGMLLFVVLFFVYPMKFLWSLPLPRLQGRVITDAIISDNQVPLLFVIYGLGVIAVFSLLALLYRYAWTRRDALELSAADILDTRAEMWSNAAIAGWGALSIAIALATARLAPHMVGAAGYVYTGIAVSEWMVRRHRGRALRRLHPILPTGGPAAER